MRDKRGISAIVATVLIILITVAAVAIIWVAVVPMINENIEFGELDGRVSVLSSRGYTVYDAEKDVAIVQVKRDVDEGVMNRIRILFLIEGNSYSSTVVAPGSGQTKTYTFDLSGYGEPESVSVAPIFLSSSGREKEGSVNSSADFMFGEIDNVDADVYNLERDYFYEMPMTGLVSWWKFDGDADDEMGRNHGNEEGNYQYLDKVLVLDGIDSRITLNADVISVGADTICSWIYPLGGAENGDEYIVSNSLASFYIRWDSLLVFYSNGSTGYIQSAGNSIDLNEWQHACIVRDNNGISTFYINGVISGTPNQDSGSPIASTNVVIGDIPAGSRNFRGSLDNVMIFDKALSQEEITAIYENQKKD